MGTCEQRDTGQGHPDKGPGHRSGDYLQNRVHFSWNGPQVVCPCQILSKSDERDPNADPKCDNALHKALMWELKMARSNLYHVTLFNLNLHAHNLSWYDCISLSVSLRQ